MEKFEQFNITQLSGKKALHKAKTLVAEGVLQQRENYCYLKIDDDYIHVIYPLLKAYGAIDKPDYFNSPDDVGAHISVIYPEENIKLLQSKVGQKHGFTISGLIKAQYGLKEYYAFSVTSPSLAAFRQANFLAPKPTFKGHSIVFHITIGIKNNEENA